MPPMDKMDRQYRERHGLPPNAPKLAKTEPFRSHQLKIARQTLKMSATMAQVMGGMTHADARELLRQAA